MGHVYVGTGKMKRLILTLFLLVAANSFAQTHDLQSDLAQMAAQHKGQVALYAKNLKTGQTVAIRADEPVQTASVIKLPIMIEAFYQAKSGKLDLHKMIHVTKADQVPGSGILAYIEPDVTISVLDAVELMMILSDNTAANLSMDAVGIPNVNKRIAAMGLKNTYLYKKVFTKATGPMPPDQPKFGLGKTTAREMAEAMENVYRCDLKDQALCDQMMNIMKRQQDREMIPRYLENEPNVPHPEWIADKVGMLDDVRNDVALVMYKDVPIVISIFTWDNADQRWSADNSAELLLASMAQRIAKEWAPAAPAK
jgi:beta-lactamase class A